jgi:hypothetical protein
MKFSDIISPRDQAEVMIARASIAFHAATLSPCPIPRRTA